MLQRECINKQESQILKELEVWPGTLEPVANLKQSLVILLQVRA